MENEQNETASGKTPLFPVSAEGKHSVIVFVVTILLIIGLTFLMWAINLTNNFALRTCLILLLIAIYTSVAVVAMKLTGQIHKLLPNKNRLWLQILIGLGIAAVLCFLIGVLPVLCGTSFIGSHQDISAGKLTAFAIEDIIFVGIGEEVVFRGYIQNQFEIWLKKCKWLAPFIAAAFFGLWHIINGSIIQVLFATAIGCVLGYCKYFVKDCTLLSVIIAHGVYDFSLTLLTCFML